MSDNAKKTQVPRHQLTPWQRLLLPIGWFLAWIIRYLVRTLWILAVNLSIVFMAGLIWLALSEQAPKLLWQQFGSYLPSVRIEGLQGRLATGIDIEQLTWADTRTRIHFKHVHARWQAPELLQGRLALDALSVQALTITDLAPASTTLVLPSISSPFAWFVRDAEIKLLRYARWQAKAIELTSVKWVAEGVGADITLTKLVLSHALVDLSSHGELHLTANWPLKMTVQVSPVQKSWPMQRLTLGGDLSALHVSALGPKQWPLAIHATINVLPVLPEFYGVLSWPRWQPPGQRDWQLAPGTLRFKGSQTVGDAQLDLALKPALGSQLLWPATWPRRAFLAAKLNWRADAAGLVATTQGKGLFGGMPWLLSGNVGQQNGLNATMKMQLADATADVTYKLPDSTKPTSARLNFSANVPTLARFQTHVDGAAQIKAHWQGSVAQGFGQLDLSLKNLHQDKTKLLSEGHLDLSGSIAQHQATIVLARGDEQARIALSGGADLLKQRWRGQLERAQMIAAGMTWHLQKPATLMISASEQHISEHCWQLARTGAQVAATVPKAAAILQQLPWQVCLQADLLPTHWQAVVHAQSEGMGQLSATLRRDPRQAKPMLDADIQLIELDLASLPLALPSTLVLAGQVSAQARLSGYLDAPLVTGQFALQAGQLGYPAYGIDWQPLSLQGRLLGDHLDWQGRLSDRQGGQATLSGNARWRPQLMWQAQLDGEALALSYAPWVKARVSPKLKLEMNAGRVSVNGQVLIPSAQITLRQLQADALRPSSDVRIVRLSNGGLPTLNLVARSEQWPLDASLVIILGKNVRLTGMGIDAGLSGQVQLTQSGNRPLAANGDISLVDEARYEAYGQRLTLRNGSLSFAGPLTRPSIRLEAVRLVADNTVGVRLSGLASAPQAVLFSDQALSPEEILSLLVLGRPLSNSAAPTASERQALALAAALSLGGRTNAFNTLGNTLGIKDFAIGTSGDSASTQVALSGYIRPDLYLSLGMGVFTPVQTARVRYQLTRTLSLEAMTSLESAITLFYSIRF